MSRDERLPRSAALAIAIGFVSFATLGWYLGNTVARREATASDQLAQAAESARADAERITVPAPANQAAWMHEHAAIEAERRSFVSVDWVRLSEAESGIKSNAANLWPLVEFQLTVRTRTPFEVVGGVVEFRDRNHRLVGCVGTGVHGSPNRPWPTNDTGRATLNWALNDAIRSALAAGNATVDYRADFVRLPDRTTRVFGAELLNGSFLATANGKAE
jgi:hypothetical protein